jgi:hypothetical protein
MNNFLFGVSPNFANDPVVSNQIQKCEGSAEEAITSEIKTLFLVLPSGV